MARFIWIRLWSTVFVLTAIATPAAAAPWKPKQAPIMTRWAKDVDPEKTLPEYPRPQMVRDAWQNLNGLWEYAIRPKADTQPEKFDGEILVPFPVESALSGVMQKVGADNRLWYRRKFDVAWAGQNVLLHFGAVDWETTVWVNGKQVGTHRGGYDPFTFDITAALKTPSPKEPGPQEIVVAVWDPTTRGQQPLGKQHDRPNGIWYTPTTGIWQTVWLEPVPVTSIRGIKITPDVDKSSITVEATIAGDARAHIVGVRAAYRSSPDQVNNSTGATRPGVAVTLTLPGQPLLWSPTSPHLHDLEVLLYKSDAAGQPQGDPVDTVKSYFGMRKISLGKDEHGVTRIMLNNLPVFQLGPLDQGFWPDGLYTAPTDEALRSDIEITKQFGFNMARKHVKVEPARWYYWCDKLGLLVWQDMPSSADGHIAPGKGEGTRPPTTVENFERELKALVDTHHNSPSIVMWVPFNEGWGQFDTVRIAKLVKDYDPTRLVNCASGWNDFPAGDVHDIHVYPGPASPNPEEHRAAVLGEFGGLGLPVENHTWQSSNNWGYRKFDTFEDLTAAYLNLITRMQPLIGSPGLSAAVYTQTTDVEVEVNGLLTYDRAIIKLKPDTIAKAHSRLYGPAPRVDVVVPTSQKESQTWHYTITKPTGDWFRGNFDDSNWETGPGGFGTTGTPGTSVRTEWKSPDIWVRRDFTLAEKQPLDRLLLLIHHDEDAAVYLNGVLAAKASGYTTDYEWFEIRPDARKSLHPGKNTIAIHCHQTGGGQYIDAGLVELVEPEKK